VDGRGCGLPGSPNPAQRNDYPYTLTCCGYRLNRLDRATVDASFSSPAFR